MMQAARRKLENERSQQRGPMHSARVDRGLVSAPHAQRESGVLAVATAHDIGEDPLPTDPTGLPRHPSQLYQAGLEGVVLFVVMLVLFYGTRVRERRGFLTGAFIAGYGVARCIGEFFRQPDAHLGFLVIGTTMGQLLSLPMMAVGAWLMLRSRRG